MNNEIKSLVAECQAATENTKKAKEVNTAGERAVAAAKQEFATLEDRYRQAEASVEADPLEGVKALGRIRKEIEEARQVVERVHSVSKANARANKNRYMSCLGDLNDVKGRLVKAISADATVDIDGKVIRQLKRGWVALMLSTNTRRPWPSYVANALPQPEEAEIAAILKDLEREFPVLSEAR